MGVRGGGRLWRPRGGRAAAGGTEKSLKCLSASVSPTQESEWGRREVRPHPGKVGGG